MSQCVSHTETLLRALYGGSTIALPPLTGAPLRLASSDHRTMPGARGRNGIDCRVGADKRIKRRPMGIP
eukprot:3468621-Prymnesium_polylepis.1